MEDETRTGDRGRGTTAHADKLVLLVENLEVTADGRLGGAKHGHELLRGDRSTLVHEPNDDVLSLTRKHARHPHGSPRPKAISEQVEHSADMVMQYRRETRTLPQ